MSNKLALSLGSIRLEKVTCGKSNCYCSEGKYAHSAYYHYFYITNKTGQKKLKKKYLTKYIAKKLRQVIQYQRNKKLTYDFLTDRNLTGEVFALIGEPFPDHKSDFYKRLHIMIRKAGVVGRSLRSIKRMMVHAIESPLDYSKFGIHR